MIVDERHPAQAHQRTEPVPSGPHCFLAMPISHLVSRASTFLKLSSNHRTYIIATGRMTLGSELK
jgi:hypothetical protein